MFSNSEETTYGFHEVIVETPRHNKDILLFSMEHFKNILTLYQSRIKAGLKKNKIKTVLLFKNHGARAGATIAHAHSQLMGMDAIPFQLYETLINDKEYYKEKNCCKTCNKIIQQNTTNRVFQTEHFIVQISDQARFPYEIEILPVRHISGYEMLRSNEIENLAEVIMTTLNIFQEKQLHFAYNMLFSASIKEQLFNASQHFCIKIIPRTTQIAGFELATGMYINPIVVQKAAESLRNTYLKQKVV